MKKLFTLIAIVLMGTANSFAYITVSDTLTSNETWTSGNTYFVSADFVIGNNNTLTIEQDVIVKFAAWTGLSTYSGELVVNGTSTNPVIFTSMNDNSVGETISGSTGAPSRGDWSGISIDAYTFWGFYWDGWTNMTYAELRYGESFYFDSTSDPDQGDVHASSLNHVFVHQFEYSGFEAHDTPLSVSYLDVSFCGYGMLLNFENTNDFSNIWISNIESPVIIDFTSCHIGDISYWNIEPQENQYIDVWYNIQDNSTLKNDVGLPYVLNNDIEANSLSVEEGSIVKLSGTLVIRDGTLDVNGSKDYPVIFTSYKDDEFGGDTNGDGNTTSPAKGDWTCVTMDGYYSDFAKGKIDWTWFRYGGKDDHGCHSNVEFWGSSNNSYIYNSRIEYSERNGIDVYKCSPSIKNNTFLNNDSSDVRILDNLSQPILGTSSANKGGNIFRKNGLDILNTTTNTIPAKYNDWGSEDSTALSQRLGNNDPSTGDVNFYPWFGNEDDYWYTYDKTAIENAGVYNQLLIPYVDAPAGTAILYQTGEGRYGKMKILQRTMSTMTLWWETYNSDGSTYSAGTNLSLASSGDADLCELDRGIRGTYLNTQDDCEFYINADGSLLTMPGTKFLIVYSYCTPLVHSGSTSGNQTWGAGTHQISNDFTINGGDTLFIEPGAVVKFEMDKKLTVNGTLMALGTQSDSIWFTSANDDSHGCIIDGSTGNPQPGDWKYITHTGYNEKHGEYRFCDFAYGGTSSSGMLSYSGGATGFTKQCTIEKSSSSGLYVYQVDMAVDSCVFLENSNHGIEYNYYSTVRVNNSSFLNNGNYAVVTGSSDIEPCSNNYATGNNLNGMVIIALGTSNYQQLINYNSMPFIIYSTVYIGSGKSLHIGGGNGSCLIKMNTDAKIQLSGGHLHTFGTTFTSLKDDSRGGDTNNDGNATSPAPGDWQNIFIQYDHDAYLSQSHFYYGGSNTATIYFANGAGGNLDQIEVRYSEWNGVYTSSSPVDIWACDISENTKSGVYLYGNDSTIIRQSDIKNNGEHGVILAYGSSATITDNQIEGNAQYPIYYFGSSNLKSPITGNILEGNLLDAVVINSLDWYKKQRFFEITGNPSSVKYSYVFLNNTMIYSTTDTLEFNAGSVVKFNDHTYLQTKGAIIANNTVFTSLHDDTNGGDTENNGSTSSPSKGDWSYIEIDQGGVAKYDYCDVRYGGYNNYASVIFYTNAFGHIQNSSVSFSSSDGISKSYSGNVVIKDNTILGNNRYGINVYGTQDTLVIDGNTISQSGSHAVYLNSTISTDINNNTFENNAGYPVYYTGTSTINDPFTGNTSSGNLMEGFAIQSFNGYSNNKLYYQQDIPFIFLNNIISYSTVDTFQVESMATLKFFPDVKLEFRGPVITHGGIMTSIKDDAWGGDTNNDGDATVAAPGDWRGLELYNTWGEFNGFIIRYAGGGSTPALNFNNSDGFIYTMIDSSAYDGLRLYNGSNVEVDNSDFNGNARYGVNANSVDTLTISNCTVQGNGNHGIYNSYAAPALDNNTFTDNGGYPVYFASGSIINKPFTGNTSSGNLMEGFAVQSFNGYAHNILYHQDDIPFIFPNNIISYSTVDTFQIENATLKFLPDIELELRGPVIANGGVLTSIKDDTWDGDSNNDAAATSPAPGDWRDLELYNTHGELNGTTIRFGGASSNPALHFNNSDGYVDVKVDSSAYDGLYVYNSSNFTIENSEFTGNERYGVRTNSVDTLQVSDNLFQGNGSHGIFNSYSAPDIDNNTFTNNGGYPVYFTSGSIINKTFSGNTTSGNLMEGFAVQSFNGYAHNILYHQDDIPFIFPNNIISYSTVDTFQIENATLKFLPDVELELRGPIITHGGVLTSIKDDTWDGDSNNDAAATSPAPGDWRDLELYNTHGELNGATIRFGGASSNPALHFNNSDGYVDVKVDSSAYDGLYVYNSSNFTIENSEFTGNGRYGIRTNSVDTLQVSDNLFQGNGSHGIFNSYSAPDIDNNTFTNNGGYPVYFTSGSIINKTFSGNTTSGNLMEGFAVQSFNGYAHNILYHQDDIPFIFPNNIISYSTVDTFQIENATLKFLPDVELELRGPIITHGGVLTSIKDDTWDGDSNNDAAATSPAPGDWRDLELYNTHGELNGATIRFGGASSNPALHFNNSDGYVDVKVDSSAYDGLYVYNSSNLTIENSEFTGNARYGINTYSVDTLQILNSIIQGNGSHGVYLQYSNAKMRGNTIINNTGYGIDNHYVSTLNLGNNDVNDKGENTIKNNDNGNYQLYNNTPNEINAYFNDWGYNTAAEIDAHIYDDNEDASKGEVHFDPWWVATDKFLSLKVYLEGPFNGTDMDIALKDGGYVPIMQPYNPALPYYDNSNPVWLYTGTESVVNIPDNVVDWVVVQLRDADSPANASSATIIDTQAAFLLKDGSVVGLDGVSALQSVPASNVTNNLYVVIYHRNHLGIMSKNALVENGGVFSYDFTTGPDKVYGGINGYKEMLAGKWGMVAGDGDGSGIVGNTDETSVWKIDLGTSGYLGGDFDLNGFGQNTDETNYWKVNLNAGGQVPGKSTGGAYKSQVPR